MSKAESPDAVHSEMIFEHCCSDCCAEDRESTLLVFNYVCFVYDVVIL